MWTGIFYTCVVEFLYRYRVSDCGPVRDTMYSQNGCRLIAQLVSLSVTVNFLCLELIVLYTSHIICAI